MGGGLANEFWSLPGRPTESEAGVGSTGTGKGLWRAAANMFEAPVHNALAVDTRRLSFPRVRK